MTIFYRKMVSRATGPRKRHCFLDGTMPQNTAKHRKTVVAVQRIMDVSAAFLPRKRSYSDSLSSSGTSSVVYTASIMISA